MTVFIKDTESGKVLLSDDGKVAIDVLCCCGCPAITLVCDSISSSVSKCGLRGLSGANPPHVYKNGTFRYDSGGGTVCSDYWVFSKDEMGGCNGVLTHDGNGLAVKTCNEDCANRNDYEDGIPYAGTDTDSGPDGIGCSISLSIEYTTAALISEVIDGLPSYDDDFDDDCASFRNLSDDENSITITRFRHKWTFTDPGYDFDLSWNEHFVSEDESTVFDTPRSFHYTTGGGNETDIFEVFEPDDNGTISITDVACSRSAP